MSAQVDTTFLANDGTGSGPPKDDGTALFRHAVFMGEYGVVKKCIEAGANVNCKSIAHRDMTALHVAAIEGHAEVVKLLLTNGADLEAALIDGFTALHLAAYSGHAEVTDILIQHGADVFAKTHHDSVLHKAAKHAETLKLVLTEIKKKCDGDADRLRTVVNAPDTEGDTPIMWAIQNRKLEATKIFLECPEIDINARNLKGWTVLHWAAHAGSLEIVNVFIDMKVDPKIKDKNGETAYDLAYGKISEDAMYEVIADLLLGKSKGSCFRCLLCR